MMFLICLTLATGWGEFFATTVVAQAVAPAATMTPNATVESGLRPDEVRARISQLEQTPDLDEAIRTSAIEQLNRALEQLQAARQWTTRAAEMEKARLEAPDLIQQLRSELTGPPPLMLADTPEDAPLADLEQQLAQIETESAEVRQQLAEYEGELRRRTDSRIDLPRLLGEARERLTQVEARLASPEASGEPAPLAQARNWLMRAQRQAVSAEIDALQKELQAFEVRGELVTVRRDLAARRQLVLERTQAWWRHLVTERRRREAEAAAQRARQNVQTVHPAMARLAQENRELAERRSGPEGLVERIRRTHEEAETISRRLIQLKAEFEGIEEQVVSIGASEVTGYLLSSKRSELPALTEHRRRVARRQLEIRDAQIQLIDLRELRNRVQLHLIQLSDDRFAADALATLGIETDPDGKDTGKQDLEIRAALAEIYQTRLGYLESLQRDYDQYLKTLVDLQGDERKLIEATREYGAFIDERIFWIPTAKPLRPAMLADVREAVQWLLNPQGWGGVAVALGGHVREKWLQTALVVLMLALLFGIRGRWKRLVAEQAPKPGKVGLMAFRPTLVALVLTLMVAAIWPGAIWLLGAVLAELHDPLGMAAGAGAGLKLAAYTFLPIEVLSQVCRPEGLGEAHFKWSSRKLAVARAGLRRLMVLSLPLVFVMAMLAGQENVNWHQSLGRLALIAAMLVMAWVLSFVLRPEGGLLDGKQQGRWGGRLRLLWFVLAVGLPLALALAAGLGYTYTAAQLARRISWTLWLGMGLMVFNALMVRWLMVERQRMAIEQARKRRAAMQAEREAAEDLPAGVEAVASPPAEPEIDLSLVNQQSQRLLRGLGWIALVAGIWLIWVDVIPAIGILRQVELWRHVTSEGPRWITLADLSMAVAILSLMVFGARNLPGFLELTVLKNLPLHASVRFAIATISRYLVVVLGIVLAAELIGMSWTKVQWLVAAISVGLGFGLQEIFANFVSGLIILFERPIRVGDIVTVGDVSGNVSRIQMRATTITDWDRRELIVPNKEFITSKLINWTLSDPITRMILPIGVAYGSDTELVARLLKQIAINHPLAMEDPEPRVVFSEFGDSSLIFRIYVHMARRDYYLDLLNGLCMEIDRVFRQHGITIAFPQQDVHLKSEQPLQVRILSGSESIVPLASGAGSSRLEPSPPNA